MPTHPYAGQHGMATLNYRTPSAAPATNSGGGSSAHPHRQHHSNHRHHPPTGKPRSMLSMYSGSSLNIPPTGAAAGGFLQQHYQLQHEQQQQQQHYQQQTLHRQQQPQQHHLQQPPSYAPPPPPVPAMTIVPQQQQQYEEATAPSAAPPSVEEEEDDFLSEITIQFDDEVQTLYVGPVEIIDGKGGDAGGGGGAVAEPTKTARVPSPPPAYAATPSISSGGRPRERLQEERAIVTLEPVGGKTKSQPLPMYLQQQQQFQQQKMLQQQQQQQQKQQQKQNQLLQKEKLKQAKLKHQKLQLMQQELQHQQQLQRRQSLELQHQQSMEQQRQQQKELQRQKQQQELQQELHRQQQQALQRQQQEIQRRQSIELQRRQSMELQRQQQQELQQEKQRQQQQELQRHQQELQRRQSMELQRRQSIDLQRQQQQELRYQQKQQELQRQQQQQQQELQLQKQKQQELQQQKQQELRRQQQQQHELKRQQQRQEELRQQRHTQEMMLKRQALMNLMSEYGKDPSLLASTGLKQLHDLQLQLNAQRLQQPPPPPPPPPQQPKHQPPPTFVNNQQLIKELHQQFSFQQHIQQLHQTMLSTLSETATAAALPPPSAATQATARSPKLCVKQAPMLNFVRHNGSASSSNSSISNSNPSNQDNGVSTKRLPPSSSATPVERKVERSEKQQQQHQQEAVTHPVPARPLQMTETGPLGDVAPATVLRSLTAPVQTATIQAASEAEPLQQRSPPSSQTQPQTFEEQPTLLLTQLKQEPVVEEFEQQETNNPVPGEAIVPEEAIVPAVAPSSEPSLPPPATTPPIDIKPCIVPEVIKAVQAPPVATVVPASVVTVPIVEQNVVASITATTTDSQLEDTVPAVDDAAVVSTVTEDAENGVDVVAVAAAAADASNERQKSEEDEIQQAMTNGGCDGDTPQMSHEETVQKETTVCSPALPVHVAEIIDSQQQQPAEPTPPPPSSPVKRGRGRPPKSSYKKSLAPVPSPTPEVVPAGEKETASSECSDSNEPTERTEKQTSEPKKTSKKKGYISVASLFAPVKSLRREQQQSLPKQAEQIISENNEPVQPAPKETVVVPATDEIVANETEGSQVVDAVAENKTDQMVSPPPTTVNGDGDMVEVHGFSNLTEKIKVRPVEELVMPVGKTVLSVEEPVLPVEEPVLPVEESVLPVEELVTPVEEPVLPVEEPMLPVEEPVLPVEEPVLSVEELVLPVEELVTPVEEPVLPVEEPVLPVEETVLSVEVPTVTAEEKKQGREGSVVSGDSGESSASSSSTEEVVSVAVEKQSTVLPDMEVVNTQKESSPASDSGIESVNESRTIVTLPKRPRGRPKSIVTFAGALSKQENQQQVDEAKEQKPRTGRRKTLHTTVVIEKDLQKEDDPSVPGATATPGRVGKRTIRTTRKPSVKAKEAAESAEVEQLNGDAVVPAEIVGIKCPKCAMCFKTEVWYKKHLGKVHEIDPEEVIRLLAVSKSSTKNEVAAVPAVPEPVSAQEPVKLVNGDESSSVIEREAPTLAEKGEAVVGDASVPNGVEEMAQLSVEEVVEPSEVITPSVEEMAQITEVTSTAEEVAQPEVVVPPVEEVTHSWVAPPVEEVVQPEIAAPPVEEMAQPEVEAPQDEQVAQPQVEAPQVEEVTQPEVGAPQVEEVAQSWHAAAPAQDVPSKLGVTSPTIARKRKSIPSNEDLEPPILDNSEAPSSTEAIASSYSDSAVEESILPATAKVKIEHKSSLAHISSTVTEEDSESVGGLPPTKRRRSCSTPPSIGEPTKVEKREPDDPEKLTPFESAKVNAVESEVTGETHYTCTICGGQFTSKVAIKEHLGTVHEKIKRRSCEYCGRTFLQTGDLTRHVRIHTGYRPFKCPVPECGIAFIASGDLHKHVRRHNQEPVPKPHVCDECGKDFERPYDLKRHKTMHAKSQPDFKGITCAVCNKVFARRDQFRAHTYRHIGYRPYQCEICGKAFTDPSNYSKHARLHEMDGVEVVCHFCGRLFKNKSAISKHIFHCRQRKNKGRKRKGAQQKNEQETNDSTVENHGGGNEEGGKGNRRVGTAIGYGKAAGADGTMVKPKQETLPDSTDRQLAAGVENGSTKRQQKQQAPRKRKRRRQRSISSTEEDEDDDDSGDDYVGPGSSELYESSGMGVTVKRERRSRKSGGGNAVSSSNAVTEA